MRMGVQGRLRVAATAAVLLGAAAVAEAGSVTLSGLSPDGRDVSARLDWSYDSSGDLELWVHNLTDASVTRSAGDTLTGVSFGIGSLSSGTSMTAATAAQTYDAAKVGGRVVATDGHTNIDISSEWGFSHLSGTGLFDLTWNNGTGPDYAIIGSYDNDTNKSWTNANGGLANANSHDPFIYETAYFKLSNTSFGSTDISNVTFYFGTNRTPMRIVPLPPSAWMGLGLLGMLGVARLRRRRRAG